MTEQNPSPATPNSSGFFGRLGSWFRGARPSDAPGPSSTTPHTNGGAHSSSALSGEDSLLDHSSAITPLDATRTTFFKPWAKRDAALANIQEGFSALTGLMGAIKENLDRQNQRQDELIQYMSHLPELLKTIPAASQSQTQTLATIAEQMKHQNTQQTRLTEILAKVSETGGHQNEVLESLHERVEALNAHDRTIADSLQGVGSAMQSVSQTSQSSAHVLEQMRDNINARQEDLQKILHKQSARYTTMLAISLFLAMAAVIAVCVFGYLMVNKMR
jgi:ABC-type transporter Mla subunit MlaD